MKVIFLSHAAVALSLLTVGCTTTSENELDSETQELSSSQNGDSDELSNKSEDQEALPSSIDDINAPGNENTYTSDRDHDEMLQDPDINVDIKDTKDGVEVVWNTKNESKVEDIQSMARDMEEAKLSDMNLPGVEKSQDLSQLIHDPDIALEVEQTESGVVLHWKSRSTKKLPNLKAAAKQWKAKNKSKG